MKNFKKINFLIFVFFIAFFFVDTVYVTATNPLPPNDVVGKLDQGIGNQLNKFDFSQLEELVNQLTSENKTLFQGGFLEKVKSVLNGDFSDGSQNFLQAFSNLFFSSALKSLPVLAIIIVIAILCGLISQIKPNFLSNSTSEIVFFACFGAIIVIVFSGVINILDSVKESVNSIKGQMNFIFPILLTLMAAVGGNVSVKVYQPSVALLSGGVLEIVMNVVFPLFVFTLVFSAISNLSNSIKVSKLVDFFKSTSTIVLCVTFTVFSAFLSIQGLTAGAFDGVSIRAAKFATKNYIPILGGYLSDGFDLILASSILIKNSFGLVGLLLLAATVFVPICEILVFSLGLKLVAAFVEPVSDKRISSFVSSVAKNLNMLVAVLLAVAFMYFLTVMLLIFTSNAFV